MPIARSAYVPARVSRSTIPTRLRPGRGSIGIFAVGAFRATVARQPLGETATGRGLGIRMMARPRRWNDYNRRNVNVQRPAQNWGNGSMGWEPRSQMGAPYSIHDVTNQFGSEICPILGQAVHILSPVLAPPTLVLLKIGMQPMATKSFALRSVLTSRDVAKEVLHIRGDSNS